MSALPYLMLGGGPGAFIGAVHRIAAAMDQHWRLVGGSFSSTSERSCETGKALGLAPERCSGTWQECLAREAKLPAAERAVAVVIVTPNHLHVPMALAALKAGFHVICDKPLGGSVAEGRELAAAIAASGRIFALTHNYTAHPLISEARALVRAGRLGAIRKVLVEYAQGWLAGSLEKTGQKQAAWRTDPAQAGASCCMGDIGTHAANLAEHVTGLPIESLAADLSTFVPGRKLDDDGSVLLRFRGGAKGALVASQIMVGCENGLRLRVYGEKAGLEWSQEEPNTLVLRHPDRPAELLRTGQGYLGAEARSGCRVPPGHPEGYLEAFANIYTRVAAAIRDPKAARDFPGLDEGLRGMAFINACVESSAKNAAWVKVG